MAKQKDKTKFNIRDLDLKSLEVIVERAAQAALNPEEHTTLKQAMGTLVFLMQALEGKGVSLKRLQHLLFGPKTEKTSKVVGKKPKDGTGGGQGKEGDAAAGGEKAPKEKPKGHGRNGVADYTGARRVPICHAILKPGAACPDCGKGRVYPHSKTLDLIRIRSMAPLQATVYEVEQLRCGLCNNVFKAPTPPEVGTEKYDATAVSMIALFHYDAGLPFNRLERLQGYFGIPLPAATQSGLVTRAAMLLLLVFHEIIRQAAQGRLLHNDDTVMKILGISRQQMEYDRDNEPKKKGKKDPQDRTGVFTTAIVAELADGHRVALFFTGRKHAGENLADVLSQRAAELSPPIQMCDALSRNVPDPFETILAYCLAHARRRFVEVADKFPEQCRHVLEILGKVYHNDAVAKDRKMSDEERLRFHQEKSGPLMDDLEKWLKEQMDAKKVEPNSGLGKAVGYTLKHWTKLTQFLRVPLAPLDNNICERAIKKAILHRRNSYFYKTENGARVGDVFMSLIHTASLCGADPFAYLTALQKHILHVEKAPSKWMPWCYEKTLAELSAGSPASDGNGHLDPPPV